MMKNIVKVLHTRAFWTKFVILSGIGLVCALITSLQPGRSFAVWLADFAFMQATVLLTVGAVEQMNNLHAFSATGWSIRKIQRMVSRNKQPAEANQQEPKDFQSYVNSRPHRDDAVPLLILGAVWLMISLLISLPYFG